VNTRSAAPWCGASGRQVTTGSRGHSCRVRSAPGQRPWPEQAVLVSLTHVQYLAVAGGRPATWPTRRMRQAHPIADPPGIVRVRHNGGARSTKSQHRSYCQ
jgi:hypothetical protein